MRFRHLQPFGPRFIFQPPQLRFRELRLSVARNLLTLQLAIVNSEENVATTDVLSNFHQYFGDNSGHGSTDRDTLGLRFDNARAGDRETQFARLRERIEGRAMRKFDNGELEGRPLGIVLRSIDFRNPPVTP